MKRILDYFAGRYLVSNLILFGVMASALLLWGRIGKEEMPEFSSDNLNIRIIYPGASAENVELFVTRPVEENLKTVTGYDEIESSSSFGQSAIQVTFDRDMEDLDKLIQDIKDAVERTRLPDEILDPTYHHFSSARKAIIDVTFFYTGSELMDDEARSVLQEYVLAFESQIISQPEISAVQRKGYLIPELQIHISPEKLIEYHISLSEIRNQILRNNVRTPAGVLEDEYESKITILSELDTVESLEETIIRGGFEGQEIRLRDIASVSKGFEKSTTIHKSQGHEAIVLHIQKNADTDILSAQRAVMQFIRKFQAENPDTPVGIATLDDESYDVRNRLSLIGTNGLAGFILIIIILFLFLDFRSGFWVALGIPFTLAFALILSYMFGYTVNNMTLAAVIIVLGIVVDDAIIVAENVARLKREGVPPRQAAVDGTIAVIRPIIASILTTCAAFLPLYFYSGWFGQLVVIIPTIIFFMLFGSFLESSFILPAHLSHKPATWGWLRHLEHSPFTHARDRLMHRFEEWYRDSIQILFRFRLVIIFGFILLLAGASALFVMKMSFVMFPREESREIAVQVKGGDDLNRIEMARLTGKLERMFLEDPHGVVLAHITRIGQSRHGGEALENEAFLRVELLPPSERDVSLNRLFREWVPKAEAIEGFTEVRFMRSRWGSDSGSPIEIEIRENDDEARTEVVNRLARGMEDHPDLVNIEIEEPVIRNEYRLQLKRSELSRLGVNPSQLGSAVRVFVEGDILYTLFRGNEEVDVRLTSDIENKRELENVLDLKIENQGAYLIPLRSLVDVIQDKKPSSIERTNFKRTSKIFAGIKPESGRTPLEIADELEDTLFPRVTKGHPNTVLQFRGEIEDSRESGKDFIFSIYLVLIIIYVLLVILFNSLKTPLLIASVIPFGVVGVIFSFIAHGMSQYGFFAVIGTLGMIGVVVNNAILMISRLENAPLLEDNTRSGIFSFTASISSTRLRPVLLTTMTTVAGLLPTAYGWGGYDSMLAEMMLALCWGLIFSTLVTLILIPCLYTYYREFQTRIRTDTAK